MIQAFSRLALRRQSARWALAICATAAGLGATTTAQAAASASVQVFDLTLTLVDLDPDDGQSAQASWADGTSLLIGQIDGLPGGATGPGFAPALSQAFVLLQDSAAVPGARAAARVGPQGLEAWGSAGDGLGFAATAISGYGLRGGGIVLGAGTGLRLSLGYALQASVDNRDSNCTACDTAQAQLVVFLDPGWSGLLTEQRSVLADSGLELFDDAGSDTIALAWDNTGSQAQTLGLGLTLSANGVGYSAAPVPEPSAALLLCGGLGLMAWLRRARRPG